MSSMASEADMWGSRAQAANQNKSNLFSTAVTAYKIYAMCIPKGTRIDAIGGNIKIEDIRPGDMIMGYDGYPVKVLHKHEYLEDPSVKRWYEIEFSDGAKVNTCDMHKINGVRAKDITENIISKKVYSGVELSYDILTEDSGYRINGVPVNSMIPDMGKAVGKIKKQIIWQ